MVFDVLLHEGQDVKGLPWSERRLVIEQLTADGRPPIQLTPYPTSRDEAADWMAALAPMGIEGVVAKRANSRYRRGTNWVKIRFRKTLVGVVGAVIRPITAPRQ